MDQWLTDNDQHLQFYFSSFFYCIKLALSSLLNTFILSTRWKNISSILRLLFADTFSANSPSSSQYFLIYSSLIPWESRASVLFPTNIIGISDSANSLTFSTLSVTLDLPWFGSCKWLQSIHIKHHYRSCCFSRLMIPLTCRIEEWQSETSPGLQYPIFQVSLFPQCS